MTTLRQRTSQLRNFAKMRLSGVYAQLCNLKNSPVLSSEDKEYLDITLSRVTPILKEWDSEYVSKLTDKECKAIAKRGY